MWRKNIDVLVFMECFGKIDKATDFKVYFNKKYFIVCLLFKYIFILSFANKIIDRYIIIFSK